MSSFSIALSGLKADSDALDVVGNNLANLNTTGYKDSTVSFYDLLQESVAGGSTQIGGGVSAPQTERVFTQGSIQTTTPRYKATDSSWCKTRPAIPCTLAPEISSSTPMANW
jgi:flagellar hook-basal body protein